MSRTRKSKLGTTAKVGIAAGVGTALFGTEAGKRASHQFLGGVGDGLTSGLEWVNRQMGWDALPTPFDNPAQQAVINIAENLGAINATDKVKEETTDLRVSRAFTTGPDWLQTISRYLEDNIDLINTGLLIWALAKPDKRKDALKAAFLTQAAAGQWRPSFVDKETNGKVEAISWRRRLDPLILISLGAGIGGAL